MKKTRATKKQARFKGPTPSAEEQKSKGKVLGKKTATEEPYRSQAERRAEGRTLRDAVPRDDHSGWQSPKDRRDPVDIVLAGNESRLPELVPVRHGRMLQSPFAFFRGTAAVMAADLAHTPSSGLRVQACGDAHLLELRWLCHTRA